MEPACRKDKQKQQTPTRGDRTKQKSAQQELKQRQRAEVTVTLPHHPHILMILHIHRYDSFVPGTAISYCNSRPAKMKMLLFASILQWLFSLHLSESLNN